MLQVTCSRLSTAVRESVLQMFFLEKTGQRTVGGEAWQTTRSHLHNSYHVSTTHASLRGVKLSKRQSWLPSLQFSIDSLRPIDDLEAEAVTSICDVLAIAYFFTILYEPNPTSTDQDGKILNYVTVKLEYPRAGTSIVPLTSSYSSSTLSDRTTTRCPEVTGSRLSSTRLPEV